MDDLRVELAQVKSRMRYLEDMLGAVTNIVTEMKKCDHHWIPSGAPSFIAENANKRIYECALCGMNKFDVKR